LAVFFDLPDFFGFFDLLDLLDFFGFFDVLGLLDFLHDLLFLTPFGLLATPDDVVDGKTL
jgi:hypothetical protein